MRRLLPKEIFLTEANAGQRQLPHGVRDVRIFVVPPFVGELVTNRDVGVVKRCAKRTDRFRDRTALAPEQRNVCADRQPSDEDHRETATWIADEEQDDEPDEEDAKSDEARSPFGEEFGQEDQRGDSQNCEAQLRADSGDDRDDRKGDGDVEEDDVFVSGDRLQVSRAREVVDDPLECLHGHEPNERRRDRDQLGSLPDEIRGEEIEDAHVDRAAQLRERRTRIPVTATHDADHRPDAEGAEVQEDGFRQGTGTKPIPVGYAPHAPAREREDE